jgi:hypothetical protein
MDVTNRPKQLWESWMEKQADLQKFSGLVLDSRELMRMKYDFIREGLYRLSGNLSASEQLHLKALEIGQDKMRKQLYPNRMIRVLRQLRSVLFDRQRYLRELKTVKAQSFSELSNLMKQRGLDLLSGRLDVALGQESGQPAVSGTYLMEDQSKLVVSLPLEQTSPGVFKAREYRAYLNTQDGKVSSLKVPLESGITMTEAVNLLKGRAVCKTVLTQDRGVVKQWMQLDHSQTSSEKSIVAYLPDHFDLKKCLENCGAELGFYALTGKEILAQLEQGFRPGLLARGKESFYVQADLAGRRLAFFNREMQPVSLERIKAALAPPERVMGKQVSVVQSKDPEREQHPGMSI